MISRIIEQDLGIEKLYVITPGADTYPIAENIEVTNLTQILAYLVKV